MKHKNRSELSKEITPFLMNVLLEQATRSRILKKK